MDHAGKGVPVFELFLTKALQKKAANMGYARGPAGKKDRVNVPVGNSRTGHHLVYAVGYAGEVLIVDRLKLSPGNSFTDAEVALCEADSGTIEVRQLTLCFFNGLKQKETVIVTDEV